MASKAIARFCMFGIFFLGFVSTALANFYLDKHHLNLLSYFNLKKKLKIYVAKKDLFHLSCHIFLFSA